MGALDKWRNADSPLTSERRLMNEALARIGAIEERRRTAPKGARLLFALDLTESREWALEEAKRATAAMFDAVAALGPVMLKLAYFRGRECKAGPWLTDAREVCRSMLSLSTKTGRTQIGRILRMAEGEPGPLSVVLIGDACEENGDELAALAHRLGTRHVPVFVFHELPPHEDWSLAEEKFQAIAAASGGAYCPFGAGSAAALRELLSTVAAFSAGGIEAVKQVPQATTPEARQLHTWLLLGPGR